MIKKFILPSIFILGLILGLGYIGYTYYLTNKPADEVMCGMNSTNNINIKWVKPKEEAKVDVIESKDTCLSSDKTCRVHLKDKRWISLNISPKPVVSRKKLTFEVKISDKSITPKLIDIVGVNINMGYLRPELKKIDDLNYHLDFTLPFCEEEQMRWKATVHFEDSKAPSALIKGALFYFQSIQ